MDIANAFNDFFSSVGRNLDNSIPLSSVDPLRYINVNSSSFFLQPVSPLEINYHIKKLKNSKQDLNTISIEILKDSCNGVLSLVLSDVINVCFEKGVFPNSLKKAIVLPLYKKGDQATLSNYRPISILPTMSKLVEKCLKTRLMNYLTDFNLINPVQFGFQANVSTQDAILHVIEKIYSNLDKKVSTMAVFIDFSKSFDTINIPIALKKLESYGIRGVPLMLIASYLSNRQQAVKINGQISQFKNIDIGVPQGSVLGPLLFLLYVNELPSISNLFSTCLFADDTTMIFESSSPTELVSSCNSGLQHFYSWCCANRLSVNVDKTNVMLFSNIHLASDLSNISLNNTQIQYASSVRFLGVEIDNKLKFNNHINSISNKISKNAGVLYKLRQFVPQNILITIYRSLVESYLNYCTLLFGNAFQSHLNPLEVAQRKCLRIIDFKHPQTHSDPIFAKLKLLKFSDMYKLNLVTYMYKNLNKFDPNLRINYFSTRSGDGFYLPSFYRLALTQNQSIMYQAPFHWNSIPEMIKNASSIKSFRRQYKKYLLSAYELC